MKPTGAYSADRASALSGVPKSTVHYWEAGDRRPDFGHGDRTGLLRPTVSLEKVKLWSYTDLIGLRTICWLRQSKKDAEGRSVSRP
jgi:hypothetical protein